MKSTIVVIVLIIGQFRLIAQITDIEEKFVLPSILSESSGIIFFNGKLISHNDSGNENVLYELDTISGTVTRIITIDNAVNIDWEDITQDDLAIYIGDIGNNNGNRTDLKIYKIHKDDYVSSNHVNAEIINFNYIDQVDFTSNPNNTEWDAEAIFSYDTALIILTKNWVSGVTKAYPVPKVSGTYSVSPLATMLSSGGLISGATYNEATDKLLLVGYNAILLPFIWHIEGFSVNDIFSGTNTQIALSSLGFEQIEAITHVAPNRYFMTSESFSISSISDVAKLMTFSIDDTTVALEEQLMNDVLTYPNPVKDEFYIDDIRFVSIEIYDFNARLIHQSFNPKVNVSKFHSGIYIIKINMSDHTYKIERIIID